jgi:hypothetical protein
LVNTDQLRAEHRVALYPQPSSVRLRSRWGSARIFRLSRFSASLRLHAPLYPRGRAPRLR